MKRVAILLFLLSGLLFAQEDVQTFISLSNTGVAEFLRAHPEYDGRGTIVIVLDTGVDMGVEGLRKTSTGEVKVIDVQDFTGQGDVKIYKADDDEDDGKITFENDDEDLKVDFQGKLKYKKTGGDYYIGSLNEEDLRNSSSRASDINKNFSDTDKYNFITYQTSEGVENFWILYFDTDLDGDLSDEEPVRNYREDQSSFDIPAKDALSNFTFGVNIFPSKKLVSFHYDDGAHGTHVSGIATGYKIGGDNLNGVAPGANVISLKIGNNTFSGGSTVAGSMRRAYEYADSLSKALETPCIINMSYGIGSEIEARSDMEKFLDNLVSNNPYLYICTSNGNSGPGISTTGLPAATSSIFSSGAALPREVGNDIYSTTLDRDIILYFSSRGGEVNKPEVISPGAAASTVPNWMSRDVMWGTSMASPYTAGVMSLLMSAVVQEYPDVKIPSNLLYKIIRYSAVPMEGYDDVDQGGGYINILNAYDMLTQLIEKGAYKDFEAYDVKSFAPNMPGNAAENLYIRNGSYLHGTEEFEFLISRRNPKTGKAFHRTYNLVSKADWLTPVNKNIYIRNEGSETATVKLSKEILSKPGLYSGKVLAYRQGDKTLPEFQLAANLVIPYEFNSSNNYKFNWENQSVAPGMVERYYVLVPAGATSMKARLSRKGEVYTSSRLWMFDPDGREVYLSGVLSSEDEEEKVETSLYDLQFGVYEIDVTGYYRADDTSHYDLSVEFFGINIVGNDVVSTKNNSIEIINLLNEEKTYKLDAKMLGYQTEYVLKTGNKKEVRQKFTLQPGEKREFDVNVSQEDYNKVTDFAVVIYDKEGNAAAKTGLSYKETTITIQNSGSEPAEYELLLLPGFANEPDNIDVYVTESTYEENAGSVNVRVEGIDRVTLYPSESKYVELNFSQPSFEIPEGARAFGEINFTSVATDNLDNKINFFLKLKEKIDE